MVLKGFYKASFWFRVTVYDSSCALLTDTEPSETGTPYSQSFYLSQ